MRKPSWLKKKLPSSYSFGFTKLFLDKHRLFTVCEEAKCPNRWECFSKKTATFLIMGPYCTRNCKFCSVKHAFPLPIRKEEIENIVKFVEKMNLKYVVITSVTRDDLEDGGAFHFTQLVKKLKENFSVIIELLIPDFNGNLRALEEVVKSNPQVIGHNIETVERLYPKVRNRADYKRSLNVLREIKKMNSEILTKSGIMVGLGEKEEEIIKTLWEIKETGCDIITIGQYLQPTKNQLPVERYYHPEEFEKLSEIAKSIGFSKVISGPFVRSSYKAYETYLQLKENKK